MDYSNLSREELLALVQGNNKTTKPVEDFGICQFQPSRPKNAPQCTEDATTPYGFCKKHARTVQAKKAKDAYEANVLIEEIEAEKGVSKESKLPHVPATPEQVQQVIESEPEPEPEPEVVEKAKTSPLKQPPRRQQPTTTKQSPRTSKKPVGTRQPAIRKKIIRMNHWSRFEDTDTHIVFDPTTKCAYGIQEPTGRVSALKPEHVEICQRNGWNYNVPYNSDDESEEDSSDEEEDESIRESDFDEDDSDEDEDDSDEDAVDVDDDDDDDVDDSDEEGREDYDTESTESYEVSEGDFDSDAVDDFGSDDEY